MQRLGRADSLWSPEPLELYISPYTMNQQTRRSIRSVRYAGSYTSDLWASSRREHPGIGRVRCIQGINMANAPSASSRLSQRLAALDMYSTIGIVL